MVIVAKRHIPVSGPSITDLEVSYVADAARNAWQAKANIYNDRFECAFSDYVGRRFAIALPSCTSALHLALAALDIGSQDEVIVPEATWIASAAPISYVGATPVFADVTLDRWCLSPESVTACITSQTRAIIAVDLYGNLPDWNALVSLAKEHGLAIIEDAAQAIGSVCNGRHAGSFGDVSVFSFHGSKTITTGEGGMLVTDDRAIYERCLFLRDHGRRPDDVTFCNNEVAYKYRMSAMQAAMGLGQIERIDEILARKRQIFDWYSSRLCRRTDISLNPRPAGDDLISWMITGLVDRDCSWRTETLIPALRMYGIDSRPFFLPLSSLPAYAHHQQHATGSNQNPIAYELAPRGINLPSGLQLTEDHVDYVCTTLETLLDADPVSVVTP